MSYFTLLQAASRSTTDECLLITGQVKRPSFYYQGKRHNSSRVVWMMAHGDPGELHVLHTCHDDHCVNIRHLYLGDQQQNTQDMLDAARCRPGRFPGELNHFSKLTRGQATEIRRRYKKGARFTDPDSAQALAKEFGITRSGVNNIIRGVAWND